MNAQAALFQSASGATPAQSAAASPGLASTGKRQVEVPRTFLAAPGEEAKEASKRQNQKIESYGSVCAAMSKGVPTKVRHLNGGFLKAPPKTTTAADAPSYAATGADEAYASAMSGAASSSAPKSITGRRQGYQGAIDSRADPRFVRPAILGIAGSRIEVPLVVVDGDPETQLSALSVLRATASAATKFGEYESLKNSVYSFVLGAATVVNEQDVIYARQEASIAVPKMVHTAYNQMETLISQISETGVDAVNMDRLMRKTTSKFASLVAPFVQFNNGVKFLVKATEGPDGEVFIDKQELESLAERAEDGQLFSSYTGRPVTREELADALVLPFVVDIKGDAVSISGAKGKEADRRGAAMPSVSKRKVERQGLYAFLEVPLIETKTVRDAFMSGEEFTGVLELHVAVGDVAKAFGAGVSNALEIVQQLRPSHLKSHQAIIPKTIRGIMRRADGPGSSAKDSWKQVATTIGGRFKAALKEMGIPHRSVTTSELAGEDLVACSLDPDSSDRVGAVTEVLVVKLTEAEKAAGGAQNVDLSKIPARQGCYTGAARNLPEILGYLDMMASADMSPKSEVANITSKGAFDLYAAVRYSMILCGAGAFTELECGVLDFGADPRAADAASRWAQSASNLLTEAQAIQGAIAAEFYSTEHHMSEQMDALDRVRRGAHSAAPNRSLKAMREADMVLAGVVGTKGWDSTDLFIGLLSHFALDAPLGRMSWTLSERAAGVATLTTAHAIGSRVRAAYPFWEVYLPFHQFKMADFDRELGVTDLDRHMAVGCAKFAPYLFPSSAVRSAVKVEKAASTLIGLGAVARSMLASTETLSDTVAIKKQADAHSVDRFLLVLESMRDVRETLIFGAGAQLSLAGATLMATNKAYFADAVGAYLKGFQPVKDSPEDTVKALEEVAHKLAAAAKPAIEMPGSADVYRAGEPVSQAERAKAVRRAIERTPKVEELPDEEMDLGAEA